MHGAPRKREKSLRRAEAATYFRAYTFAPSDRADSVPPRLAALV